MKVQQRLSYHCQLKISKGSGLYPKCTRRNRRIISCPWVMENKGSAFLRGAFSYVLSGFLGNKSYKSHSKISAIVFS